MNPCRAAQRGFSLLEVLITFVILGVGLLGLTMAQARMQRADFEAYQRAQALVLLSDIVDRMNANRGAAGCYAITNAATGAPYAGAPGAGSMATPACALGSATAEAIARANADLVEWDALLRGASVTSGGAAVGAMVGARGCVSFDAATRVYTVVVAWQGVHETFQPTVSCATGLYGADTLRRAVQATVRMAVLL
jgi:type IV pilus assembly protein PilV